MSERRVQTESELVELVRGSDLRAPQHLHDRVQALVDDHTAGRHGSAARRSGGLRAWLRPRPLGALAGGAAAAAAAVAIALATAGGGAAAPSLATASAFTLATPTAGAPAESATAHRR